MKKSIKKSIQGPIKSAPAREFNFDGLVGLSHNYAGLSEGNVASSANKNRVSNPKLAALQGLKKMEYLESRGIGQAIIPPLLRPNLEWLRRLGFTGKDSQVLEKVGKENPALLATAWSASSMWTANAATLSPSQDSADGLVHITPANLASQLHRTLETPDTGALLKKIFMGPQFIHHPPLPSHLTFGDEGAANHMRLSLGSGKRGLQIFAYGFQSSRGAKRHAKSRRFLPRQSWEASQAIARLHALDKDMTIFAKQRLAAIDAGVFHNDVISVGNGNILFCHSQAYENQAQVLEEIRCKSQGSIRIIEVKSRDIPLDIAVSTYLFNSQLIELPEGGMLLLAAEECRQDPQTRTYLERLIGLDLGITEVAFVDLRQSMRNGGGPACLRLHALLTPQEWESVAPGVKVREALLKNLRTWVEKFYRDHLSPKDLVDPQLLKESQSAHLALMRMLEL